MTRKDYQLIAAALELAKPSDHNYPTDINHVDTYKAGRRHQWANTCKTMADYLATTNPLFDRTRFLDACGVEVA